MRTRSARFRYNPQATDTGKTDGHHEKDVIITEPRRLIQDLNLKPVNENYEFCMLPSYVNNGLEAHEKNLLQSNKRKLNKTENVSKNGGKNKIRDCASSLAARHGSNQVGPKSKSHDGSSSSAARHGSNLGLNSKSRIGHESVLILMSSVSCYLHVMVCDDDPKCPKCGKGDSLHGLLNENQVKKYYIVVRVMCCSEDLKTCFRIL